MTFYGTKLFESVRSTYHGNCFVDYLSELGLYNIIRVQIIYLD